MSKGSGRRPRSVEQEIFDAAWDKIWGNKEDSHQPPQHKDELSSRNEDACDNMQDKQGQSQDE